MKRKRALTSALFISLLILAHVVLVLLYNNVIMTGSRLNRVDHQFHQLTEDLEYLILGDSHAQDGLNPGVLPNGFNFASSGENWVQTYYKLNHILKDTNTKFRTLVLPFDLHSFSSFRSGRFEDLYYWSQYIEFIELGEMTGERYKHLPEIIEGRYFPYFGQGRSFLRLFAGLGKKDTRPLIKGYIGFDEEGKIVPRTRSPEAKKRARRHFKGADPVSENLAVFFKRILKLCNDRGINVVLVKFPVTREYYSAVGELIQIDEVDKEVSRLVPPGSNTRILDFRRLFFDQQELLADVDHLNPKGAEILTKLAFEQFPKKAP